jgi:hypothetical protein
MESLRQNEGMLAQILKSTLLPSVEDAIGALEVELLKHEQVNCPVQHHFSPGLYIREVFLPAGTVAIGHMQKTEHLNIFLKGRVSIVNENGGIDDLKAPMLFTGKPGRKCGYIHEDVVWLNIYPTEETDIETLESMFLDKSDNWEASQLKPLERIADREDYKLVLSEYGYTEEMVREQTENTEDQIPFPYGSYQVGVFESQIEGRGLFATSNIKRGGIIAPASIGNKRTPAGRYTNHSINPNAVMERSGEVINLIAISDISGCMGGIVGDEITVNYRQVLELKGE